MVASHYRVALRAILDRFCARRLKSIAWVGTRKRDKNPESSG
jgi:hypothetical protein